MTKIQKIRDIKMSKKVIVLVLLLGIGISGFFTYRSIYKTGYLTLANPNPFQIVTAIRYQTNENEYVTEGWWTLKPGEQITLERGFTYIKPNFAVYGQSDEPETVRFLHNLPDEHPATIYFEGNLGDTVSFQNVVPPPKKMEIHDGGGDLSAARDGTEPVAFVNVPVNKSSTAIRLIHDASMTGVLDDERLPATEEDVKTVLDRAALLAKSLTRQQSYFKKFPNPVKDYPFDTGLKLEDQNGLDKPGVCVINVDFPTDLYGNKMPFQNEDIIFEFSGQIIFSNSDLLEILAEHASSKEKGIEVPIDFKLQRGSTIVAGQTTYFFNKEFWGDQSKLGAFGVGVGDSITFGNEAAAEALAENVILAVGNFFRAKEEQQAYPDYKDRRWHKVQRNARFKNFEPGYYDAGSAAGLFFPSAPRLIFQKVLARQISRKIGSKMIAKVVSVGAFEITEGVMWTVGTSSPAATSAEIAGNVTKMIPIGAGVGVISGVLTRRR